MLTRNTALIRRTPLPRSAISRRSRKVVAGMNRRDWVERLDDLFRAIVMIRAGAARMPKQDSEGFFWYGRCQRCLKLTALYVSHIEPKGEYPHMRWADGNAFAFCYACHMHWWHKNPRAAYEFSVERLGVNKRVALAAAARSHARGFVPDHKALELEMVIVLRRMAPQGVQGLVL